MYIEALQTKKDVVKKQPTKDNVILIRPYSRSRLLATHELLHGGDTDIGSVEAKARSVERPISAREQNPNDDDEEGRGGRVSEEIRIRIRIRILNHRNCAPCGCQLAHAYRKYHNTNALNKIVPLENLGYVKRVRKKCQDGGKNELSVMLCLASEQGELDGVPNDVLELFKEYQLSTFVAKLVNAALIVDPSIKQIPTSSISLHPLRHAAMVAIGHSAARDRLLYPDSGHSGAEMVDYMVPTSTGLPSKRQKINLTQVAYFACLWFLDCSWDVPTALVFIDYYYLKYVFGKGEVKISGLQRISTKSLMQECAMGLVHQRVKRIFYALPNPNAGALGSVHRLEGERSLNHRYAVFRVLLPEEMHKDETLIQSSTSENFRIKI
ncbi:hypothetical protein ACH5RR_022534 [Cinchona calisaya]|uniref:Uncharacterized protein n=1 Tax=Cinchona calisaya TaxID=153742 RepID=A0ABD2ZB84_9GENT